MKISFFGSSLVSAYWNGAATYYRGILRALAQNGNEITFYEPDAYDRQAHRDIPDPSWARVIVYPADHEKNVLPLMDEARTSDLVVKASGVGVFDELLEKLIVELKSPSTITAFWDVDAPATLDRVFNDPDDPFRALIPQYDFIFTYGGGDPVVNSYKKLGAKSCTPIYNAMDPDIHFPVAAEKKFMSDLAFLGNRLPDREARVEEFFLKTARLCRARLFLLGGNGWETKELPANVKYRGHVYTRDHNAFNSTPLAVLNINRESMFRYGFSPATRVFEAAGAAACIISDRWEGIETFLEPDKEILVAENGEHVRDYLDFLTLEKSNKIGKAARKRVLADHTYSQRARQVQSVLESRRLVRG
jgi:spore maturation protein CgeB